MSIFKTLLQFGCMVENEKDYQIWILAFYKLCRRNPEEETLQLIMKVVENAIDAANRTGNWDNYFSRTLAAECRKTCIKQGLILMEEL